MFDFRSSHVESRASASLEPLEDRVLLSADGLTDPSPWGVATSAETRGQFHNYTPLMADAGVDWIRAPAWWKSIQPTQGLPVAQWDFSDLEGWLATATANGMHVNSPLVYNAAWAPVEHTLPTAYLDDWGTFVHETIDHFNGDIDYWEIWNEAPNFTGGASAADYAAVVVEAYDEGKAADPNAQLGLSIARNDLQYLREVINAGAADHFDFIAIHPYEVTSHIDDGVEVQFMNLAPRIRELLQEINPEKADVPIWITEVGTALTGSTTEQDQADDLVKIYTMGIAQGFERIEWFEAYGNAYDLGLLNTLSDPRKAYDALDNMTALFGDTPQYLGWTLLNTDNYAFVFEGATQTVMVTWANPGETDTVNFGQTVTIIDPVTGSSTSTNSYSLTNSPVFVTGVPTSLVNDAKTHAGELIPSWGGYDTPTQQVSVQMAPTNVETGLHHINADSTSTAVVVGGDDARDVSQKIRQHFTIDPRFLPIEGNDITIEVVARKKSGNAGFNVKYESVNGLSGAGWRNVTSTTSWQTFTFNISDALFVNEMGFNFFINSDSTAHNQFYIKEVRVTNNEYAAGLTVNVNGTPTQLGLDSPYPTQDAAGSDVRYVTSDDVTLLDNAWKLWDLNYTVTSNTKLQFTVNSGDTGEILGIALDNNTDPLSGRRAFRFGGSDVGGSYDSWSYRITPTYTASNGDVTYTVDVGSRFTGAVNYLGLFTDDDADGSGVATFKDIRLYEDVSGLSVNINGTPTRLGDSTSYGSQDGDGGSATNDTVSPDGESVTLTGNPWKKWELNYTVTQDTMLQFTVDGSDAGEILAITLDNDTDHTTWRRGFRFGGSDVGISSLNNWSWRVEPTYVAGSGATTYTIDVGSYFTGTMNYLGLIADDDANASSNITFSNITLVEAAALDLNGSTAYGSQDGEGGDPTSITVSPNGSSATLAGNAWKKWSYGYTVTENTWIQLTVDASDAGEIIGFALDNDSNPTNTHSRLFNLGGSQTNVGNIITPRYSAGSGTVTYAINVGAFFTGTVSYFGLIADDDGDASTNAIFSNIRIFEA